MQLVQLYDPDTYKYLVLNLTTEMSSGWKETLELATELALTIDRPIKNNFISMYGRSADDIKEMSKSNATRFKVIGVIDIPENIPYEYW